jgi:hypothetical protein
VSGATFNDETTSYLYIQAPNEGAGDTGATATVNNEGTWTKSGRGTSSIDTIFNNTGTVNVQSGTLNLAAGGTDVDGSYQGAGTIQFSGGTRTLDAASSITATNVTFAARTTTVAGTYDVAGITAVSGGTADLSGAVSDINTLNLSSGTLEIDSATGIINTLNQTGGLISGTGTATVTGATTITGGVESGSGTTVVQEGATIGTAGQATFNFGLDGGRTLQLGGSSLALGTNTQFDLNAVNPNTGTSDPGSGILAIASGATFNDETMGSGLSILASNRGTSDNGSTAAVDNQGTWEKTGSAATSTVNAMFNNAGTVNVESGTLNLASGITNTGEVEANGGNLVIAGALGGNALINGSSTLEFGGLSSTANVTFSPGSTGTLRLDVAESYLGTIAGLSTGNFLDCADIPYLSGFEPTYTPNSNNTGGELDIPFEIVQNGNDAVLLDIPVNIIGQYTANQFVSVSDGHGGTLVHDPAPSPAQLVQAAASIASNPNLVETPMALMLPPGPVDHLLTAHPA